jgi:hypothetical protein
MNTPLSFNTIAMALGALFLVFAVIHFFRLRRLGEKGIKTVAIITDFTIIEREYGFNNHIPILEYKTLDGKTITKRSYIGTKKNVQHIGDKLNIVYNPEKPEEFLLDTGMDKYWKILGSVIAGLGFMGAGFFHLFG